jgi:hypothetical protein
MRRAMEDREKQDRVATLRWKIDKDLEVYQFYMDVSVKGAVFLMTLTGAIASYVLSNLRGHIPIALAFPALMNAGFAVLFFYSIGESNRIFELHREECRELGIAEFNMKPLRSVCQLFALMFSVSALGIVLLMVFI